MDKQNSLNLVNRANAAIARCKLSNMIHLNGPSVPRAFRWVAGGALLALSIPILPEIVRYGWLNSAKDIFSLWIVGLVILTWPTFYKSNKDHDLQDALAWDSPALRILGYENSLVGIQLAALFATIISGSTGDIWVARFGCVVTLVLTPVLFETRARLLSIALGAIALCYAVYFLLVWDFAYEVASMQYARALPDFGVPIGSILWIAILIAAFPQLQIPRLGRFGLGRLRGDITLPLYGSRVPVALASALFICCAWRVFWLLLYAPGWLPVAVFG